MTSTQQDRFNIVPEEGVKAPCRLATTANVTLSGLQTIDGASGAENDRILVNAQSDASENGIWVMQSTAWVRASDWDDNTDVLSGILVASSEGSVNSNTTWQSSFTGTFSIDTTEVTFTRLPLLSVSAFAETYLDDATAAATRATLGAAAKPSSAVTDNIANFDSSDEVEDSGISKLKIVKTAAAGGTADALTATFSPVITFVDGVEVRLRALLANATTTPALTANAIPAKTIVKNGNQALAIGDIAGPDHELILVVNTANDNYELLNPADQAGSFTSAEQTITPAGSLTVAHGLASSPTLIQTRIICKTAELGYSIGDEVITPVCESTTAAQYGISLIPDATNLNIRYGSAGNGYVIPHGTTGAAAGISNANWKLIIRAWVL